MNCKWLVDVVARVDIDGERQILYQGLEFRVLEDNEYIKNAIALGWIEVIGDIELTPIEEAV